MDEENFQNAPCVDGDIFITYKKCVFKNIRIRVDGT